jgi:hypothetical protein
VNEPLVDPRRLVALAMAVASCTASAAGSYPSASSAQDSAVQPTDKDDEITFGGPETMYTMARADCRAAGVSALWRGVTVRPERFKAAGLRSVRIQFAAGEDFVFQSLPEGVRVWPEVVFSPDCRRVALLATSRGPYVIVATRALRSYLKGRHVAARYLDDQVPCAAEFRYYDLRWLSNDEVEYRSGGEGPMPTRHRRIENAPDHYERKRCLDPNSPLHEGPSREKTE